jgi:hypothetical protein
MIPTLAAAGLALGVLATALYLVRLLARRAPFSRRGYDAAVGVGAALAVGLAVGASAPPWMAIAAGGLALGWFAVTGSTLWLPTSGRQFAVGVGDPLPPFRATTTEGTPVTDRYLMARAPVLLVLYRGRW